MSSDVKVPPLLSVDAHFAALLSIPCGAARAGVTTTAAIKTLRRVEEARIFLNLMQVGKGTEERS